MTRSAEATEHVFVAVSLLGRMKDVHVRSEIDVARIGEATVVALDGDADLENIHMLRHALGEVVAGDEGQLVVDLRNTSFIDSSGLSALLNAMRRLTRQGRKMAVVADTPDIVRPLEMTYLAQTLNLTPSLREALDAVGA